MRVRQIVRVGILNAARLYTYDWFFDVAGPIRPLLIGDRVELPPNQVCEEGSSGLVRAYGSDYNGPMKQIIRKVAPSED